MNPAHSHRDLIVWQKAMSLATDVYLAARAMPSADRFVLGTQLQRTAISLLSNIAEGWGRGQRRVLAAHVRIALGSDAEPQTQLELARRVEALRGDVPHDLLARSREVGRLLHGLLRSVAPRPDVTVVTSRLLAPGPWLLAPGPWLLAPGSCH
jgi:four helix bundle protein